MLLLELGQLTLDETSNISEPSIASTGFLTAALPISLSSPLPTENRTSVSKTSVYSSRKYFVHLHWVRLATNPSWFDSSIGRAVVEKPEDVHVSSNHISLETANFPLFSAVSDKYESRHVI